ncbi:MAG TPA: FAD-linked oxidase C-terminal domain-containing protein [Candidatus Nitrosotalea sp.]|nr:FAD-linked oxidase C-terminal domain-containing protein [Candidatus Nitrosotalea sp.]
MGSIGDLALELTRLIGSAHVLAGDQNPDYARDATFLRRSPLLVVRPADTEQVAGVMAACQRAGVAVVARGAGTSLVGGPVALSDAVVLSLERLQRLEIDAANAVAVAGAGVITAEIDRGASQVGLMYPPDPASVEMCSIGGNVACNSGGMRCLKYGVTADYVVGLTVVRAGGEVLELGGRLRKRSSGYRLMQLFVGSEGTLGVVTEVILKLIPLPRHRATALVAFPRLEDAAEAVSRALGAGFLPCALELLDRRCLDLVEEFLPPGFEPRAGAALLVEQDGSDPEFVQLELLRLVELMAGSDNRVAQSSLERERLWRARREVPRLLSARALGRFSEDVAVPLSRIPEMVRRCQEVASQTGLEIYVYGHAGDGNLHPSIMFRPDQRHLVAIAARAIFLAAIELGGTISGEHGLGALKRDHALVEHGPQALGLMRELKRMLDPQGLLNPHKVLPESAPDEHFLDQMPGWADSSSGSRS